MSQEKHFSLFFKKCSFILKWQNDFKKNVKLEAFSRRFDDALNISTLFCIIGKKFSLPEGCIRNDF